MLRSIAPAVRCVSKHPVERSGYSLCAATLVWSRRLLRRHLLHLARSQVEAHPLDLVEIGAGHADETRVVGIVDGVDLAVLVDAGMARKQPIFLHRLELGLAGIGAVTLALPFRHLGVMGGLTVNGP